MLAGYNGSTIDEKEAAILLDPGRFDGSYVSRSPEPAQPEDLSFGCDRSAGSQNNHPGHIAARQASAWHALAALRNGTETDPEHPEKTD